MEICREVRRVLRDDGVFWLNYGDCYGHGTEARRPSGNTRGISDKTSDAQNINRHGGTAGNLMMMPHRVALALQQDGWIVRQDLVWFKRNPMPESVNGWRWQKERTEKGRTVEGGMQMSNLAAMDAGIEGGKDKVEWEYGEDLELKRGSWRHTRAHEYVFMLTKKMGYWSNQEAIREAGSQNKPWGKSWGGQKQADLGHNIGGRLGIPAQSKRITGVIEGPTLLGNGQHLFNDFGLQNPFVRAYEICVGFSAAILDLAQGNEKFRLATFDAEIRNQLGRYLRSIPTLDIPTIEILTGLASSFHHGDTAAKSFVKELDRLGLYLRDIDALSEMGALSVSGADSGIVGFNEDASIGVDDSSEVSHDFAHGPDYSLTQQSGRNPRSVLDVPTAPYKGAHYATFPPNLIAPLIRATCPRWACPVCGQGWAAVVEDNTPNTWHDERTDKELQGTTGLAWGSTSNVRTLGYRPTCEHEHTQEEAVPGIVFDPFVGSGTTVAVAKSLLRRGIGIDISMEYLDQQAKVRAGLGTPSNALDDLPLFQ